MDPRETLYIARNIQRSIDRRRAELKRLKEFETYLSATDYSSVVVKHSADRGSVERIATSGKLATLERVIAREVEQLAQAKLEAIALISLLEDREQQEVLWEYYIHAPKNWDVAADNLFMSRRKVLRLNGRALQVHREKLALNGTV